MTDEQQHHPGGVAWEASQALKAVRRAREAGDADAEDLGWLRYAEALTNASYSGAAAAFLGILATREDAYLMRVNEAEQQRQQDAKAVFDLLQLMYSAQGDNAARLGKIEERVEAIDSRHGGQWEHAMAILGESIDDRRQLNARVADLLRRIVAIEQRLNLASEAP